MKTAENVSVQEKMKQIKDECLKIASFFERCHESLFVCRNKNKSEVSKVVVDLIKELETTSRINCVCKVCFVQPDKTDGTVRKIN